MGDGLRAISQKHSTLELRITTFDPLL